MSTRFEIDSAQLDQLARQFHAAGVELADLDPANQTASRAVIAASSPPRRSGALAASLRADVNAGGITFASTARYWTFAHYGAPRRNMRAQPWYPEAIDHSREEILKVYAAHAEESLKQIG